MNNSYEDEGEFEPVPGLPQELPEGERIIWQGAPTWRFTAVHMFHVRKLAIYFALILIARHVWLAGSGIKPITDLAGTSGLIVSAAFAIGLLTFMSWLIARTTLYTLTNKRVVMRLGIALPMTLNLPFSALTSADVRRRRDGSGDIIMRVSDTHRLSYVVLWPHIKMRSLFSVQPTFRSIADPDAAAEHFSRAIAAADLERAPAKALDTDQALIA